MQVTLYRQNMNSLEIYKHMQLDISLYQQLINIEDMNLKERKEESMGQFEKKKDD